MHIIRNEDLQSFAFEVGKKERHQITAMLTRGRESARVLRRAMILRQLDEGQTGAQVARNVAWRARQFARLHVVIRQKDWSRRFMKSRAQARLARWT